MEGQLNWGLQTTVVGVTVVFTALITVWIVVTLFQKLDRPEPAAKSAKPAQPAAPPQSAPAAAATSAAKPEQDGALAPETAAVIAAAVTAALGRKVRIHRVQYRSSISNAGIVETAWSRQGRVSIMTSHLPKS